MKQPHRRRRVAVGVAVITATILSATACGGGTEKVSAEQQATYRRACSSTDYASKYPDVCAKYGSGRGSVTDIVNSISVAQAAAPTLSSGQSEDLLRRGATVVIACATSGSWSTENANYASLLASDLETLNGDTPQARFDPVTLETFKSSAISAVGAGDAATAQGLATMGVTKDAVTLALFLSSTTQACDEAVSRSFADAAAAGLPGATAP